MNQKDIERFRAMAEAEATRSLTFEELFEDIAGIHIGYTQEEDMTLLISKAVARLPRTVQDFVLDRVVFVSIGRNWRGLTVPRRRFARPPVFANLNEYEASIGTLKEEIDAPAIEKDWGVILDNNILEDSNPEDAGSTVAHEIAHAWLNHDSDKSYRSIEEAPDIELEAATQARQWGFTGRSADPQNYRET